MELKETIMDEEGIDYLSVFSLSPEESSRVYDFKSVISNIGERGISLEPKQRIILNNRLMHEVLVPYVEEELNIKPVVGARFHTDAIFDGLPHMNIRGQTRKFHFNRSYESYVEIFPVISFIVDNETELLGQAYFSEHNNCSPAYWEARNLDFEVIKDGAILLAEQKARKIKSSMTYKLYKGGLGLYVTPVNWLNEGLGFVEKVYSTIKKEDLEDLGIIKWEKNHADKKPVKEALELGYNRKLEKSLESILEFFNFPL